jgi:diguanylate cyclase (GGDEF)-like protein/PAS domain S-box-containing protein
MASRGEAVRNLAGKIVALRGTAHDITDRRRVELALRDSESRFRAIFNSTFQFIGVLTTEGRLIEVNDTALAFGGVQAADVLGQFAWDTYWWNARLGTQRQLQAAVARAAKGEFIRYDVELRGADGAFITIDFSLKPVFDAEGRVSVLIPEGRDVSEDRRNRLALAESENRFRQAMRNAPIGKALVDLDGRIIEVNEALCEMLGYSEAALSAKTLQQLAHPDDLETDQVWAQALLDGAAERYRIYKRYRRSDDRVVDTQLDVTLLRNSVGAPLHFIAQIQDISERKRLEAQQRALTQRLTLALGVSGIGVWELDVATNEFEIDESMVRIYGLESGAATDYAAWRNAVLPEDFDRAERTLLDAIEQKTPHSMEFRILHPKFGVRFIESAFGVVCDAGRNVIRVVGVNMDVTERWQAEQSMSRSRALLKDANQRLELRMAEVLQLQEQLREQSIRDGLTGLYNRRHFDDSMASELAGALRESDELSLIIADLDHFKQLNDRYGHQAGDATLRAWGRLVSDAARNSDVCCRYGGEEFAILLPRCSPEQAARRAEQLRLNFAALKIKSPSLAEFGATVSLGVASITPACRSAEQLIRDADAALYLAKQQGRNCVRRASPAA